MSLGHCTCFIKSVFNSYYMLLAYLMNYLGVNKVERCSYDRQQLGRLGKLSSRPAPARSALELLRAVFSPHCSSPCTPMTAHLETPLSSSSSLQMTPHWSASFRMVTSLLTDRSLRSWLSGAVLTTWSWTRSKQWKWSWTSGEPPPPPPPPADSPPTHHHEQLCDCSGVIQIPGHHYLPGPEVGQSHWVHCEKGPAEAVLPSPAEKVQPATGAAETVLFCHHWIRPLHVNNCLQLQHTTWKLNIYIYIYIYIYKI